MHDIFAQIKTLFQVIWIVYRLLKIVCIVLENNEFTVREITARLFFANLFYFGY